jgi:signal transduction histidine kinase
MERYESGDSVIGVAGWSRGDVPELAVGTRFSLEGASIAAQVHEASRPVRVDSFAGAHGPIAQEAQSLGIRSSVGCPIVVEGRLWGVIAASSKGATPFPADTESQIAEFTELVATAIANTESRARAERLAEEQAALRRVATLVAEGDSPTAILDAAAAEMEALLHADQVALNRYEPGDEISVLAHRGLDVARTPVGSRVSHEGENVTATVRRTRRPARVEHHEGAPGGLAELARETGLRVSVGAPIVVDRELWGIITASWKGEESPPADTEERMAQFARLLDTAIANADSRAQLVASRARLLTAGDDARRRIVRDLHDGAQQRLVHTIVTLKLARRAQQAEEESADDLLAEALDEAELANAELRELAHGMLPPVLTRGGLRAGVDALVSRVGVPVDVTVAGERLPAEIEASAYFVVAEALTNVVKHSRAQSAEVRILVEDGVLHVEVRDDGVGGARSDGTGLFGLEDRLVALGGRLRVESPPGQGTRVVATLPFE